jgi:hypothetical protein
MTFGGVSLAMGADAVGETRVPRPPLGREDVPTQLSRPFEAHALILGYARQAAGEVREAGDEGTNDLFHLQSRTHRRAADLLHRRTPCRAILTRRRIPHWTGYGSIGWLAMRAQLNRMRMPLDRAASTRDC